MPTPTFPSNVPSPSFPFNTDVEAKVLVAEFGDDYSQAAKDGVNNLRFSWELTWENLTRTERDTLIGFFQQRGGAEPFFWTNPEDNLEYTVYCRKWRSTFTAGGSYTATATFKRTSSL